MKNIITSIFLALFAIPSLLAQAPGGVGDLSGTSILRVWLRADSAVSVATDGSPIDTWNDLSGAGNNLVGSAASRPYYQANALNGHPGVSFSGAQWMNVASTNATFNNTEATLFVLAYDSVPGNGAMISISSSGYTQEFLIYSREPYHHTSLASFVRRPHQCLPTYTGTYGLSCGVFGTTDTLTDNYFNGLKSDSAYITNGAPVAFTNVDRQLYIGQRLAMNGAEYFKGTIVEVIGYNVVLTNAQREAVENYLLSKYNLQNANCGVLSDSKILDQRSTITVFPNPSMKGETISVQGIEKYSPNEIRLSLYNVLGEAIPVKYNSEIGSFTFPESVSAGIYILQIIENKNVVATQKIILY